VCLHIEDGIAHQLPRIMTGYIASAIGEADLYPAFGIFVQAQAQILGVEPLAQRNHWRMLHQN